MTDSKPNFTISLTNLPIEILERILKEIDNVYDLLSVIDASDVLYHISNNSKSIWTNRALDLLDRWRPLSLYGFNSLIDYPITELKRAVTRATSLEYIWSRKVSESVVNLQVPIQENEFPHPLIHGPTSPSLLEIYRVWDISLDYILVSTRNGCLAVWNIRENVGIGMEMLGENRLVQCCTFEHTDDQIVVSCVTQPSYFRDEYNDDFPRRAIDYNDFCVMQITISKSPNGPPAEIEEITRFRFPKGRTTLPLLLDQHKKIFAALVMSTQSMTLAIYILNYDTRQSRLIQTDQRLLPPFGHVLSSYPECEDIIFRAMTLNEETMIHASLHPSSTAGVDEAESEAPPPQTVHCLGKQLPWIYMGKPSAFQNYFYRYSQSHRDKHYNNTLLSTSLLLKGADWLDSGTDWSLMQYYSDINGAYGKQQRCVVHLSDASFGESDLRVRPIISIGFRHAVWIERTPMIKRLMLATFPPPPMISGSNMMTTENEDEIGKYVTAETKIMEVPLGILDAADDILLSEREGYVLLICRIGVIYTLRYA